MERLTVEICVLGYTAASFLLEQQKHQWHALVMLDTGLKSTGFVEAHALTSMYLRFDDIEVPRADKQAPTIALIQQGLEFARGKEKLLVSCRAGQSRSVALAYLIGCDQMGATAAIKLLDPTRHCPNRLVVALGDSLLGDPSVLDRFDQWREDNRHVKLSDYYEQLEQEFDELEARGARNRIAGC